MDSCCKLCGYLFDIKRNLRDQFDEEHPAEPVILAKDEDSGKVSLSIRFSQDPPTYAIGMPDISYCPICGRKVN